MTTCVTLASTVVTLGALGPPQFQGMILVLNVALQNAMACKVYRILRLELSLDSSTCSRGNTGASTLNFVDASTLQDVYRTTETPNNATFENDNSSLGAIREYVAQDRCSILPI